MDGNPEKIIYRDIRTSGEFIGLVGLLSICWAALYFILSRYTDGAQSLLDSFTAAVGVIATWMTARRFIESWLLWIAVNIASVCLYYNTELYFTMSLYLCYVVLSVVGYLRWKKRGIRE
jgi:nicotinamide mononucleotide transporter